ncbi:MAG: hypothetical protein H0U53_10815 [Actinobacteria bacterium]|nr:hypothetical protein [Actinomycetota bacterium]
MTLAEHVGGEGHLFGWTLGLIIGFTVVAIVVVVVATILTLAARLAKESIMGTVALDVGRVNTLPLWDVQKTNDAVRAIIKAARTARGALGG